MAFVTLEDIYGSLEVIVFPKILDRYGELLVEENAVFVDGRVSIKEEEQANNMRRCTPDKRRRRSAA